MAKHRRATRRMQVSERSNVQIQCSGPRNVQHVAQKDPWLTVFGTKVRGIWIATPCIWPTIS